MSEDNLFLFTILMNREDNDLAQAIHDKDKQQFSEINTISFSFNKHLDLSKDKHQILFLDDHLDHSLPLRLSNLGNLLE